MSNVNTTTFYCIAHCVHLACFSTLHLSAAFTAVFIDLCVVQFSFSCNKGTFKYTIGVLKFFIYMAQQENIVYSTVL